MNNAIFVQDETLLYVRQFKTSKDIINIIETDEKLLNNIRTSYERSRLSELSRPEDLREVDMNIPGILPMFFRDLVKQIWEKVIPLELKEHMMSLKDDFVLSYCFSRALSDSNLLSSSNTFAEAYLYALVLSVQLRLALQMSRSDRYSNLISKPDYVTSKLRYIEDHEQQLKDKQFQIECEKKAFDIAYYAANPKAAKEREDIRKEKEEEEIAWNKAKKSLKKGIMEQEQEEKDLEEAKLKAKNDLIIDDINYDSDLDAINNDVNEDTKKIALKVYNERKNDEELQLIQAMIIEYTAIWQAKKNESESKKKESEPEVELNEQGMY